MRTPRNCLRASAFLLLILPSVWGVAINTDKAFDSNGAISLDLSQLVRSEPLADIVTQAGTGVNFSNSSSMGFIAVSRLTNFDDGEPCPVYDIAGAGLHISRLKIQAIHRSPSSKSRKRFLVECILLYCSFNDELEHSSAIASMAGTTPKCLHRFLEIGSFQND